MDEKAHEPFVASVAGQGTEPTCYRRTTQQAKRRTRTKPARLAHSQLLTAVPVTKPGRKDRMTAPQQPQGRANSTRYFTNL